MRILTVDLAGETLDWSMRCQEAGHQVKWYCPETDPNKNIGKGIVTRVPDLWEWWKWADLIVYADNTKWLDAVDTFRRAGWPVISATNASAAWELDRKLGIKIFEKAGVGVLPSKPFHDYDTAIAHVKKTMMRYVSKPNGTHNTDKAMSYVSKSPQDMVYMLERWKKLGKVQDEFILQDFKGGTEMAVGGWFGPGGFSEGFLENFEFKKMFDGDHGPNTGEMGTVIRYVKKSKLADKVLLPCAEQLARTGHVGYVDVNCIIDDEGNPWPLEFTMRMGWPTFNIQQAIHDGDPAEWLVALANGQDEKLFVYNKPCVGVVMAIPDFPYSHITRKEVTGIPVYGMKASTRKNIHPNEMMMGMAPMEQDGTIKPVEMLLTAGDYVLVATGTGETVKEAKRAAMKVVEGLEIPNSPFWRTDISDRLAKSLPLIQKHGYATNLTY